MRSSKLIKLSLFITSVFFTFYSSQKALACNGTQICEDPACPIRVLNLIETKQSPLDFYNPSEIQSKPPAIIEKPVFLIRPHSPFHTPWLKISKLEKKLERLSFTEEPATYDYALRRYGAITDRLKELSKNPLAALHLLEQNSEYLSRLDEEELYVIRMLAARIYDEGGYNPLHLAAALGKLNVVRVLAQGSGLETPTYYQRSPLHEAAEAGQDAVVSYLLNFNYKKFVDKDGNTALHLAAMRGNTSTAALLSQPELGLIQIRNKYGETPLHLAVAFGKIDTTQELSKYYPCSLKLFDWKLDCPKDKRGQTPLHIAAAFGKLELVKALIPQPMNIYDINFTIVDDDGWTPLHYATFVGNFATIPLVHQKFPAAEKMKTLREKKLVNGQVIPAGSTPNDIALHFLGKSLNELIHPSEQGVQGELPNFEPASPEASKAPELQVQRDRAKSTSPTERYKLDHSYLEQKRPPAQFNAVSVTQPWRQQPNLTLTRLGDIKLDSPSVHDEVLTQPFFKVRYLSQSVQIGKLRSFERVTFVFPGRGDDARVPQETEGGRVILVVPARDEKLARGWVGPHSDVLLLDTLGNLTSSQIGLLAARRLAVFRFSAFARIKNFIMIDDNIDDFYVSSDYWDAALAGWPQIYKIFEDHSVHNGATCLSARTLRPTDKSQPQATKLAYQLKDTLGSKIFYIDAETLFKKLANYTHIQELFPRESVDAWGEDVWMLLYLRQLGEKVGVLDRKTMLYTRVKGGKRKVCAKTVKKADIWTHPEFKNNLLNAVQGEFKKNRKAVHQQIAELVERNIEQIKREWEKVRTQDPTTLFATDSNHSLKDNENEPESSSDSKMGIDDKPEDRNERKEKKQPVRLDPKDIPVFSNGMNARFLRESLSRLIQDNLSVLANFLEPRQINGLEHLNETLKLNQNSGYFEMATGTGKTNLFLTIASLSSQSPELSRKNIAIIVPTRDLVAQTVSEVKQFNKRIHHNLRIEGVIAVDSSKNNNHVTQERLHENQKLREGGYVIVFCKDSFINYLQKYRQDIGLYSLFLVDEIHKCPDHLINYLKSYVDRDQTSLFFGFSATPGKRADFWNKKPIYHYSRESGLQDHILCPWIIDSLGTSYSEEARDLLFMNLPVLLKTRYHPNGNLLNEQRGIIWVDSVDNAKALSAILIKEGIQAKTVHSKEKNRQKIIEDFKNPNSNIRILIAVGMLKMGFDAQIDYEIIARKVSNRDEWVQIQGRALRIDRSAAEQNKIAYIIAFDNLLPRDPNHNCVLDHISALKFPVSHEYLAQLSLSPQEAQNMGGSSPISESDHEKELDGYNFTHYTAENNQHRWYRVTDPHPSQTNWNQSQYLSRVRNITRLVKYDGQRQHIQITPNAADGNCGFHALGGDRNTFIANVKAYAGEIRGKKHHHTALSENNIRFEKLMNSIFWRLHIPIDAGFDSALAQWEEKMRRVNQDGEAIHWLDEEHLKLYSFLYNAIIHLYVLDPQNDYRLMAHPSADTGIINWTRGTNPSVHHLAHFPYAPNEPGQYLEPNHFEKITFLAEDEGISKYTRLGFEISDEEMQDAGVSKWLSEELHTQLQENFLGQQDMEIGDSSSTAEDEDNEPKVPTSPKMVSSRESKKLRNIEKRRTEKAALEAVLEFVNPDLKRTKNNIN